jgi:hypothetical protein
MIKERQILLESVTYRKEVSICHIFKQIATHAIVSLEI